MNTSYNTGTAVFVKTRQLQEIKMDLSRGNERKTIGVFVFGSETKHLGWIRKDTISEVERMDQMELEISLTRKKFHFSKIDYMS